MSSKKLIVVRSEHGGYVLHCLSGVRNPRTGAISYSRDVIVRTATAQMMADYVAQMFTEEKVQWLIRQ